MPSRRQAVAAFAAAALPARAMEPVRRLGPPRFLRSLAAYSLRDHFTGKAEPKLDLPQFLDYAARLGAEGVELTSYYFPPEPTDEFLRQLKRQGQRLGLEFSFGAIANDFCQRPGPKLDADRAKTALWCRHYETLGVRTMRVFAGSVPRGEAVAEACKRCVDELERACADAGQHGVTLALENHGGITDRPEKILAIVRAVRSPWFGVNLDTGNFRLGPDPYADLEQLVPYAVNVQAKLEMYRNAKIEEKADLSRVATILRTGKYAGWVALEYESKESVWEAMPRVWVEFHRAFSSRG